jgi:diguanylate cyclase (GGDEF)-like protein
VYVLLLTARTEKEDLVLAMEAGADDYLTKPFEPQELQVRLRAGRRIVDLQGELIQAREELRHQATHDALTGLWNRSAILDALEREIARALREGKPIGVIMADLDHFKRINDVHGHPAGDEVLREASRRMTAAIRPYDSLGRYGGEEFLAVMPGCDETCSVRAAERLRAALADRSVSLEGEKISVTLSLGIAAVSDPNLAEADRLIKAADEALYRAKESGRNRVAIGKIGRTG